MDKRVITLTINGDQIDAVVNDNTTLLDFLRDRLHLYGTKKGCEQGECGACTVQIDDLPVNSCGTLAVECEGHEITTIEGVATDGKLHPIQQQFIEKWALQCGYCTPGMIISAKCLLEKNPNPTELEIREAIEGNLCRCTGYKKIVEAIQAAAVDLAQIISDPESDTGVKTTAMVPDTDAGVKATAMVPDTDTGVKNAAIAANTDTPDQIVKEERYA